MSDRNNTLECIGKLESLIIEKAGESENSQEIFNIGMAFRLMRDCVNEYDPEKPDAETNLEIITSYYDALQNYLVTGEYRDPETNKKAKKTILEIEILKLDASIERLGYLPFYTISHPNTTQSREDHLKRTLSEFFCIKRFSGSGQNMVYGCNTAEFTAVKNYFDSICREKDFSDKTEAKIKQESLGIIPPDKTDVYHHEAHAFGSIGLNVNFTFHDINDSSVSVLQEYKGFVECFPDHDNQLGLTALRTINRKNIFDAYRKETGKDFFNTQR